MKSLRATIISNKKTGDDFRLMRLESAYLAKTARPGQFVEVRCSAGSGAATDPLLRRPFGVHRIVKGGIEILYKTVGRGTGILSRKEPGDEVEVLGPLGNGFDIKKAQRAIIVAGGIGAAPLVALAQKLGKADVFIGARSRSHIMCEKEFKALGCTVRVATEDGSKGYKGLITVLLEDALRNIGDARRTIIYPAPEAQDDRTFRRNVQIYACGPTGMLKAVAALARSHGVNCQVSLEERMACGVGVCLGCPVKVRGGDYKMVCKDGPVFDAEEIVW